MARCLNNQKIMNASISVRSNHRNILNLILYIFKVPTDTNLIFQVNPITSMDPYTVSVIHPFSFLTSFIELSDIEEIKNILIHKVGKSPGKSARVKVIR